MDFNEAALVLKQFRGSSLTKTLASIEKTAKGLTPNAFASVMENCGASDEVLEAAGMMKEVAGQISVVIHATGILLCLPHVLDAGETIEYISLGAGNTGRKFDLETDRRVAEFKFIRWRGADSIREGALFKDFYALAEHPTQKRKYLYVLGTEYPLKFLNGGRAIASVLEKHARLLKTFTETHGDVFTTVRNYYLARGSEVNIADVSPWVQRLVVEGADEIDQDG